MRTFSSLLKSKAVKIAISVAAAAFFTAAPAKAYWGPFDGGGRVTDYFDQVQAANAAGRGLEIAGVCASACTMKLGARHVCVYRDAELWFHAAHDNYGRVNDLGTRILLRQYPSRIRNWVLNHNAVASNDLTTMTGFEAIRLGVQDCEHPIRIHSRHRHHFA